MLTVLLNPLIRKLKFHDHQILASSILSSFFFFLSIAIAVLGFPRGSDGKESTCNVGDSDMIPGLERSPGEGHDNPLQYSCLENSMDKGAWQATVMRLQRVGDS